MDAKARSLTFLSNEGQLTIPFFQRAYVWDEENWADMLSDLLRHRDSNYLGSLILKQVIAGTGDPKEVMVIDGQQRLTTLSILVKAVYDLFPVDVQKDCLDTIRQTLFFKVNRTDKVHKVKIKHSHVDADAFSSVIKSGIDAPAIDLAKEVPNESRIIQCYRYFRTELAKVSEDARAGLFNRILNVEHKMLVIIDLLSGDDEQTIFDVTNTAGVRLSSADIIKNAIWSCPGFVEPPDKMDLRHQGEVR